MIYVEMGGRYGNQLFHYACARYIQIKTGQNELVLNYNRILSKNNEAEGWKDVLRDLNVVPYKYYEKSGSVLINETSLLQKILVGIKLLQIKLMSNMSRQKQANASQWFSKTLNQAGIYWIREGMEFINTPPINTVMRVGVPI